MKDSILKATIILGTSIILVTGLALFIQESNILLNLDFSYLFTSKIK